MWARVRVRFGVGFRVQGSGLRLGFTRGRVRFKVRLVSCRATG